MLSQEEHVQPQSEYFVYTPSLSALEIFFYPVALGHFFYSRDYFLHRNSFESYLVMYILDGSCTVCTNDEIFTVRKGEVVCLDCYQSHAYYSKEGWEALWLHYDGVLAKKYMEYLVQKNGHVITLKDYTKFERAFFGLIQPFRNSSAVTESQMSLKITVMLTELMQSEENRHGTVSASELVEKSVGYIQDHLHCQITLQELAENVNLSKYYYGRQFKKETGFTPYEYLILARLNHAKYLLNSTSATAKEICYMCGFTNESTFCKTFKKWEKKTPIEFRNKEK